MKIFESLFSVVLVISGCFTTVFDATKIIKYAESFPRIQYQPDYARYSLWVLILGILLIIAGVLIFRGSKKD
jgi:uncharacterized membrane protein